MTLATRSIEKLTGVHPDLVRVVEAAHGTCKFHVTDGVRTLARQKQLVAEGKSKTLKSRHLVGCAVDLVAVTDDGKVSYDDDRMRAVADAMKRAAGELGIPIEWGGDWKSFVDTPHFQLPADLYPDAAAPTKATPGASSSWAVTVQTFKESKTILGGLMAFVGLLIQWLHTAIQVVMEAAAHAAEWTPVSGFLSTLGVNAWAVGAGLSVFGIALAVFRRISDAIKANQHDGTAEAPADG